MRAVFLDSYALNPGDLDVSGMEKICPTAFFDRTETVDLAIERIADADVVVSNKTPITKEVLDACASIKYVTVTATGYNIIDTVECAKRGIPVSNVPNYSTNSVSQHIFALLLELTNHVSSHHEAVCEGKWQTCPDYTFQVSRLVEIAGKTIGFIGMGAIGSKAAQIAQAFGMKTVCYHSSRTLDNCEHVSLDTLLKTSDVIALCCPLTSDNKDIINSETIAKMKDGAILINTSRGGLIDEDALYTALSSGKLAGAGLDVLKTEPPKDSSPLINAPNCIITPHIAWAPKETRARLLYETEENIRSFINGCVRNKVN